MKVTITEDEILVELEITPAPESGPLEQEIASLEIEAAELEQEVARLRRELDEVGPTLVALLRKLRDRDGRDQRGDYRVLLSEHDLRGLDELEAISWERNGPARWLILASDRPANPSRPES